MLVSHNIDLAQYKADGFNLVADQYKATSLKLVSCQMDKRFSMFILGTHLSRLIDSLVKLKCLMPQSKSSVLDSRLISHTEVSANKRVCCWFVDGRIFDVIVHQS